MIASTVRDFATFARPALHEVREAAILARRRGVITKIPQNLQYSLLLRRPLQSPCDPKQSFPRQFEHGIILSRRPLKIPSLNPLKENGLPP